MLEKGIDDWLEEFDRSLGRQSLSLENYLQMRKLTEEELRTEVSPQVQERLKRSLALNKFVELEGFESESSEVEKALERLSAIAKGEVVEVTEEPSSAEIPLDEEGTESTEHQVAESESENDSERSEAE